MIQHENDPVAPQRGEQPAETTGANSAPAQTDDAAALEAARTVARQVVAEQWPELAAVEPTVTARCPAPPSRAVLAQVDLEEREIVMQTPDGAAYTFTFAAEERTPEGYRLPRIARVTVDAHRRVVKATVSK